MNKMLNIKRYLGAALSIFIVLNLVLSISVLASESYYYDDGFDAGEILTDRWSGNYAPDRITYSYDSTEGGLVYTGTANALTNYAWIDFDLDSVKTAGKYNIDVTYSFNGSRPESGEFDFIYLLSSTTDLPTTYQAKMSLDGWATPYIRTITSDCKGCEVDKNFAAFGEGSYRFRENTSSGVTTFIDEKITTRIYVDLDNGYVTFANKIDGVDADFVSACHKTSDGSSYETGHAAQFPITALQTIRFSGQNMTEGGTIAIYDVTAEEVDDSTIVVPEPDPEPEPEPEPEPGTAWGMNDGFETGEICTDRWSANYEDKMNMRYDSAEGGLVYNGATPSAAESYGWIDFDLDSVKTSGKYSIDVTYSFNGSRSSSGNSDFIYLLSSTTALPTDYKVVIRLDGWGTPLIYPSVKTCMECNATDKGFAAFEEGNHRYRESTSGDVTTFMENKITTRFYVDLDNGYVTFANKIEVLSADFVSAHHKADSGYEKGHEVKFPIDALQTIRFSAQKMSEGGTIVIHSLRAREYINPTATLPEEINGKNNVAVDSDITFSLSAGNVIGIENIKVYKNDSETPVSNPTFIEGIDLDGNPTLKYGDALEYSTKYKIVIPEEGVESDGMVFAPAEFVFHTEHKPSGIQIETDSNRIEYLDGSSLLDATKLKATARLKTQILLQKR